MTDGILIVNKPQNWTSHDCVAVCRRALGIKKIGHGGTLDPMAEGLLPIFIGRATRIMEYMNLDYKVYECTVKFGIATDTQDIWGEVLYTKENIDIDKEKIKNCLEDFKGEILQIPPKYSALKLNGKKLYEYARQGIEVKIKPRKVDIRNIEIFNIDLQNKELTFIVECSKGTYIRTICHDLGEKLGYGGSMSYLKRISIGNLNLDDSITPDEIKTIDFMEIKKKILPIEYSLTYYNRVDLTLQRAKYFVNGAGTRFNDVKTVVDVEDGMRFKVFTIEDIFLGIGYYSKKDNELKIEKIFIDRQEIEQFK